MYVRLCRAAALLAAVAVVGSGSASLAVPPTGGTGPGGFDVLGGTSALRVWLRADALTGSVTPGSQFATWTDSSFFGYNVTDAVAPQATFNANVFNAATPQPGVSFNNANTGPGTFSAANFNGQFTNGNNATLFTAYQNNPFPANGHLGITTTGPAGSEVDLFFQGFFASYNGDFRGTRLGGLNLGYPSTGQTIKTVVSSAAANNWQLFADGQSLHSTTQDWSVVPNFLVGTSNHGSSSFTGDIGEVIVFNTALNSAQRQIVENYLSSKYDMPLNAGDVYSGDTVGNGHFDREVFGVGRVNATNISAAAGAGGFGIEATSGLDDGEFIMAGHKLTTNGTTTANIDPDLIGERWTREWFVDTNGDAVNLQLAFDFAGDGIASTDASDDYQLLFRPNESADFLILSDTGTISGNNVLFNLNSSEIGNGLVTLGINVQAVPEPTTFAMWTLLGLVGVAIGWRRRFAHN